MTTSNPNEINLHRVEETKLRHAEGVFYSDGCAAQLVERRANEFFTFVVEASRRNGHAGRSYEVEIYRDFDRSVRGRCTCAAHQPLQAYRGLLFRGPPSGFRPDLHLCFVRFVF